MVDDPQDRFIEALNQIRDELHASREEEDRRYRESLEYHEKYREEFKEQQKGRIHVWYLGFAILVFALGVITAFAAQDIFLR